MEDKRWRTRFGSGWMRFYNIFEELEDPRSDVNLQHPLVSVVVIAIMAVLAGAGGPTAGWPRQLVCLGAAGTRGLPLRDVSQRNANGSPEQVISGRTPWPVDRLVNEAGTHRVQVHVVQFFVKLRPTVSIEIIVAALPQRVFRRKCLGERRECLMKKTLDLRARTLLPLLHKVTQLPIL